ncbi:Hypothetical predicted protein, partial [Paramuricea clavata]
MSCFEISNLKKKIAFLEGEELANSSMNMQIIHLQRDNSSLIKTVEMLSKQLLNLSEGKGETPPNIPSVNLDKTNVLDPTSKACEKKKKKRQRKNKGKENKLLQRIPPPSDASSSGDASSPRDASLPRDASSPGDASSPNDALSPSGGSSPNNYLPPDKNIAGANATQEVNVT